MKRFTLTVFGVLGLAGAAHAQGYNIDFGSAATVPTAAYIAASGQAGCWTRVNAGALTNLLTLGGCAATMDTISGTGIANGTFNHPNTITNHQRHMDDWVNLGAPGAVQTYTITLNSLMAPQWFAVWTYSWGSQPGVCSGVWVDVPGSIDPVVLVQDCGNWPAGIPGPAAYTLWQHFSYHEIQVLPGGVIDIVLTVDGATPGNGRLNGIQLVPIAGPSNGGGVPPNYNPG